MAGTAAGPDEAGIAAYVRGRFAAVRDSGRARDLVAFQEANKYLIMSRDQEGLRAMGRIVAGHRRGRLAETLEEYGARLERALARRPTAGSHYNVIQHMMGHFSGRLDGAEAAELRGLLEELGRGGAPVGGVLARIAPLVHRLDATYLAGQTYFLLYSDPRPGDVFSRLQA